jgi:hypothetical protein
LAEHLESTPDVDHDAVRIEGVGHEGGRNRERRAMETLGGTENIAPERVCDHDVIGNFDSVHELSLIFRLDAFS